jgi:aryl-alcohol dehydrogenase-like predicted oxidoreductase
MRPPSFFAAEGDGRGIIRNKPRSAELNMTKRQLGRSDIWLSPLAFGANVFGWTVDEARSFELLDAWVDQGFDFIDTADVYSTWAPGNSGGESESIIGRWLRRSGKRDRIVIATKVGKPMGPDRRGLSPSYIRQAVEDSLRRLQTDRIDLYQSHDDDAETPLEDTLACFGRLVEEGKVRAIGASNYSADRLRQSLQLSAGTGLPRYESLQPLYNLYDRAEFENKLEATCVQGQLGVLSFYSLASGFLTGKYRSLADASKSPRGPGVVRKYLNPRGETILAALDAVAARHGATPGQIAIAWTLARPSITAPIASATSVPQLLELAQATRILLQTEDLEQLNLASG